jgi:hypothetical protein
MDRKVDDRIDDRRARLHRLTETIDWAESEAAALQAPDAGMCLQLARLALQARDRA